jgi:predicted DsbA family dithiol-disulfide isomerase
VTLEDVARAAELRTNLLEAAVADAEIQSSIDEDAQAANSLGVRSIPLVFVDGKRVPRVRRGDDTVIDWILESATVGRR